MWSKRSFGSPKATMPARKRARRTSFHTWIASEVCATNSGAGTMKGEKQVIERLNEALFLELGAVNQYWVHFRLLEDWGYTKLAKKERAESIEEMHHADRIVARIIFLEGHPNLQTLAPLRIGQNVKEVLESDLAGEYDARTSYRKSREICQELGDYVTMQLFEDLLKDEEGHIDFLETQLDLLADIGDGKYGQLNADSADEAE